MLINQQYQYYYILLFLHKRLHDRHLDPENHKSRKIQYVFVKYLLSCCIWDSIPFKQYIAYITSCFQEKLNSGALKCSRN